MRLLLFYLELLDVVACVVGLDQNSHREHIASAVQIADSILHRIGAALIDYLEAARGIVGEEVTDNLTGLIAAAVGDRSHDIHLKIVSEPYRQTIQQNSGHCAVNFLTFVG